MNNPAALAWKISLALGLAGSTAQAADRFEMLPSDTDPAVVEHFRMIPSDAPPSASQQTIYDGTSSAGSASLATGPDQAIVFRDDATASSASIVNNGGQTLFEDRSTAAASSLTANDQGQIRFFETATAAGSDITVNDGGHLDFDDDATAGAAQITNNASMRFAGRSSAGNAQIVVNGAGLVAFEGSARAGEAAIGNSGLIGFFGTSSLDQATITNNEGGAVYFSDDSTAGTTSFIGNSGDVIFAGRSTLANGAITNNATGITRFEDDSGAGAGFISTSGAVIFTDRSSAEDAEIVGNEGGLILFRDDSTAGQATISGGAELRFAGHSSAGAAAITMAPGTTASFTEQAGGGTARFQLDASSALDISAAEDQVTVGSISGAGGVRLGANTLGVGDDTPLVNFAGDIEDGGAGGGLLKYGEGTLNLSGESNYSGATIIAAGTLEAGAENAFARRSAFTIESGAALGLAGFDQEIGSLAGAGSVDLSAESVLTAGANDASTVFSGVISGSGGLMKTGAGELALTGVSSYLGGTEVVAGVLRVAGDISSSELSVRLGGTLLGSGTVGSSDIAGTIVAEAEGDALTFSGNLTLAGSANSVVEVSGSQSGEFDVMGTAALGGTLNVRSLGPVAPGFEHVFLTAGSISGEYDAVLSDFAFLEVSVTYAATSATLNLDRNGLAFDAVADTRNQRATAVAAEALGPGNDVYDAVLSLSDADARAAFDNLSGEGHAALLGAMASSQAGVRRAVLDRARAAPGSGIWGDVQKGAARQASDGNGGETNLDTLALVSGRDLASNEDYRFGLYAYLGRYDLSVLQRSTQGEVTSGGAGIYGEWSPDRWRLSGGVDMSYNAIEMDRAIAAGALTGSATSDYNGWAASAYGEAAYPIETDSVSLEPYFGLAYTHARTNGFVERGADDANLISDGSSLSRLDAEIGARASTVHRLENGVVVQPTLGVGYVRNVTGAVATSTHRFQGGQDFTVASTQAGRHSVTIDARIEVSFASNMTADLFYRGRLSEAEYGQLVGAGLKIAF